MLSRCKEYESKSCKIENPNRNLMANIAKADIIKKCYDYILLFINELNSLNGSKKYGLYIV